MKLSSKSISTDGAEGRALPDNSQGPEGKQSDDGMVAIDEANETVSSFLKSLTLQELEEEEEKSEAAVDGGRKSSGSDKDKTASSSNNTVVKRTGEVADGRFRIGDIHTSGAYGLNGSAEERENLLKRSQSTGDMDHRKDEDDDGEGGVDECVVPLDSDHSSGERPDAAANKGATATTNTTSTVTTGLSSSPPTSSSSTMGAKDVRQQQAATEIASAPLKASASSSARRLRARFVRQKSFEIDSDSTDTHTSLVDQIAAAQTKRSSLPANKLHDDEEDDEEDTTKVEEPPESGQHLGRKDLLQPTAAGVTNRRTKSKPYSLVPATTV